MSKFDGDEKLEKIKLKVENDIELTEQDIMTLSFIPLMNSEKNKSDIRLESIEVISTEIFDMESIEDLKRYLE